MAEPIVHMPVVATTTSYDAQVSVALATDASPGVIVTVTMADGHTSERARVFAPQRGYVTFLPMGAEAPVGDWSGGTVAAPITVAADAVVLELHAVAYLDMQRRLDPLGQRGAWFWVIEGIDLEAAEAFLDSALTTEELDRLRLEAEDETLDFADLESDILAGRRFVAADQPPGTPITEIPKGAWTDGPFSGSVRVRVLQGRGTLEALEVHEITDPTVLLGLLGTLVPELADHPLVVAAQAVRSEFVTFDVVFQYWKPVPRGTARSDSDPKGDFAPIPLGSVVTVRGIDGTASYEIATGVVGLDGRLEFDATGGPSVLRTSFRASTSTYWFEVAISEPLLVQYGAPAADEPSWSGTWSTQGLVDRDRRGGEQGSLTWPGAAGPTVVGSLVYIVGIPVFAAVRYERIEAKYNSDGNILEGYPRSKEWRPAPPGQRVETFDVEDPDAASPTPLRTLHVDEDGEIWGSVFEYQPGSRPVAYLQAALSFRFEDADIALPEIALQVIDSKGLAFERVSAHELGAPLEFLPFRGPMRGTAESPYPMLVRATGDDAFWYAAGAMHVTASTRDVHAWFHHLTEHLADGWATKFAGRRLRIEMSDTKDKKEPALAGSRLEADRTFVISMRGYGANVFEHEAVAHEVAHGVFFIVLDLSFEEFERMNDGYYLRPWDEHGKHADAGGTDYEKVEEHHFSRVINPYTALLEGFSGVVGLAFGGQGAWFGAPRPDLKLARPDLWPTYARDEKETLPLYERLPAHLNIDAEGPPAEAFWGFLHNQPGTGSFADPALDPALHDSTKTSFDVIGDSRGALLGRHPYVVDPAARAIFEQVLWRPLLGLGDPSTWVGDHPQWASILRHGASNSHEHMAAEDRRRLGSWLVRWGVWTVDGDGFPSP